MRTFGLTNNEKDETGLRVPAQIFVRGRCGVRGRVTGSEYIIYIIEGWSCRRAVPSSSSTVIAQPWSRALTPL